MSDSLLAWSPVIIGFTLAIFMYGTTLGQSICYCYWFPNDPRFMKILVLGIFLADTVHLIGCTQLFWAFFVSCHRNNSASCNHELPWGGLTMTCLNCIISFVVQCFYCHRIWTISGKNKFLTLAVFVAACAEFGSGTWYNVDVFRVGTVQYLFQCQLIIGIAVAGTVCDILITSSIFKYMWKSGFRRQRTIIQDLAVVCINMGAFTCITSVATGVMFFIQGDGYWVASVGMVIGQSYVNSMLAVLNARKAIRDRDVNIYELPSILSGGIGPGTRH